MRAKGIFVQVASYRDPQLVPTLVDLIEQSSRPGALRIVVCWQHGDDETLEAFLDQGFVLEAGEDADVTGAWPVRRLGRAGAVVELIDVPRLRSRGVCWARNLVQQRYEGEAYTLQLDSHHRFVSGWDDVAIGMLESLRGGSRKPALTTYLPAFDADNDPEGRVMLPSVLLFREFDADGIVLFAGRYVGESEYDHPIPGSFYSAHFCFADGSFATEVRHDPDLFFYGEEISIAVRAYTHGYDFFYPHRLIAWHRYGCEGRVAIWQEHTEAARTRGDIDVSWEEHNDRARARVRRLLGVDGLRPTGMEATPYGFGRVRSLAGYEEQTGLCFASRTARAGAGQLPPPGAEFRARSRAARAAAC
ncbi:Glycosyltransferase (GlcNAc) [Bordetella sputigena]|uniref:GlcNAc-transferase family protein n=1 Tax=Bordetella sputigena TaxID=1416810 RepID=UPI0039EFE823